MTEQNKKTTGTVVKAFGNLLHVAFEGSIRQGEVAYVKVGEEELKTEVIEIAGDIAKVQVFEDARGVHLGSPVVFTRDLVEAELGPGLLGAIFDGLQNPLEEVASTSGIFLSRGIYLPSLDRKKKWDYKVLAREGRRVKRGDCLGEVMEGRFAHKVMVPFKLKGTYTISWTISPGSYAIEEEVAKLKDEQGREIPVTMLQKWPIKIPLFEGKKIKARKVLDTALRVIDTQYPLVKGGTFCTPGPFGAGKTVLQHHLSKYSSVDIVVITACGERAGEVVEVLKTFPHLVDRASGEPLIKRTIMICNTSSMPVAAREASVYMGATLSEYYRQMGFDVLLLADSTSRWAQAMREMSGRLEEIPGEEAFPAYLPSRIAAFYERSGVIDFGDGKSGSLTIGGTVSPAGGNFEEPVTQATLSSVGAFLGLSRQRSDARRYPAIDPLISWSKYIDDVSEDLQSRVDHWAEKNRQAMKILRLGDEVGKRMEVVGEEGIALEDFLVYLKAELYDFCYLQQNAFDAEDSYCPLDRQIALFSLIHQIFSGTFAFNHHDEAREFFLTLQSDLKNLNFTQFESAKYRELFEKIKKKITSAMES